MPDPNTVGLQQQALSAPPPQPRYRMNLNEALAYRTSAEKQNPDVAQFSNGDFADLAEKENPGYDFSNLRNSNFVNRGVSEINQKFGQWGNETQNLINPNNNPGLQNIAAKTANFLVGSLPYVGATVAANAAFNDIPVIGPVLARGAMATFAFDTAANSGQNFQHSLASGALMAAMPSAGTIGSAFTRGLVGGEAPAVLGKFLPGEQWAGEQAGSFGSGLGRAAGFDASGAASQRIAGAVGAGVTSGVPMIADMVQQGSWQKMSPSDKVAFALSTLGMGAGDLALNYAGAKVAARNEFIAKTQGVTPEVAPVNDVNGYLKGMGFNYVDQAPGNVKKTMAENINSGMYKGDTITPELTMLQQTPTANLDPATKGGIEDRIAELKNYGASRDLYQKFTNENQLQPYQNDQGQVLSSDGKTFAGGFEIARRIQQSLGLPGNLEDNFLVRPDGHVLTTTSDDSVHSILQDNGFKWQQTPVENPDYSKLYSFESDLKEGSQHTPDDYLISKNPPPSGAKFQASKIGDFYAVNKTLRGPDGIEAAKAGYKPPSQVPGGLDNPAAYSVEQGDKVKNTFMVNNILSRFTQALSPRVEGTRIKPSELQADKNGLFDSAQVKAVVNKALPGMQDIVDYYNAKGLNELLKKPKISGDEFTNWIRENTPDIEIKKDVPKQSNPDILAANNYRHQLETEGWSFDNRGNIEFHNAADPEKISKTDKYNALLDKAKDADAFSKGAKSFTYQVEPIPVSQMDRPVAILVREPQRILSKDEVRGKIDKVESSGRTVYPEDIGDTHKNFGEPGAGYKEPAKFTGSHHGSEDKNVLAFARGYFSDKDTFHVFEIQSDWFADQRSKEEKISEREASYNAGQMPHLEEKYTGRNMAESFKDQRAILKGYGNSLLPHYIKLALRASINHALENGASKLAISTADTNMKIEGHDLNKTMFKPGEYESPWGKMTVDKTGNYTYPEKPNEYNKVIPWMEQNIPLMSPQEGRARKIYDLDSQKFMEKITGDKGQVQALGKLDVPWRSHETALEPLDAGLHPEKGTLDNSARVYDLSNLKPGWNNLFSLYDTPKQYAFTKGISDYADKVTNDAISKTLQVTDWKSYFKSLGQPDFVIKRLGELVKQIKDTQPDLLGVFKTDEKIGGVYKAGSKLPMVNWTTDSAQAAGRFFHEFSHQAQEEYAQKNPVEWNRVKNLIGSQSNEWRLAVAKDIVNWSGAKHISPEYIAGLHVDPSDPLHHDIVTRELQAGMMEAIAYKELQAPSQRPFESIIQKLPVGVQNSLRYVVDSLGRLFGTQYPSATPLFSPEAGRRLQTVLHSVGSTIASAQLENKTSYEMLGNLHRYEPENLARSSTYGPLTQLEYRDPLLNQLPPEVRSLGKDILYSRETPDKDDIARRGFEKVSPFWKHAASGLGLTSRYPYTRDWFNTLLRMPQSIRRDGQLDTAILGNDEKTSLSPTQAAKRYWEWAFDIKGSSARQDTFGRAMDFDQGKRQNGEAPLTQEERKKQFPTINLRDNEMIDRFYQATEAKAYQNQKYMRATHGIEIAKILSAKGDIPIEVARKLGTSLQAIGDSVAARPDPETRLGADLQIRQALRGLVNPTDPRPGQDPLINMLTSTLEAQAKLRNQYSISTQLSGYAPKVRMKRFIVDAYNLKEDGTPDWENRAGLTDYGDEKSATEAASTLRKSYSKVSLMDKEGIADRYQFHVGSGVKDILESHERSLVKIISDFKNQVPDTTPGYDNITKQFDSLISQAHQGIGQDIKDAISVKGTPWAERRMNVAGYDHMDYIPNTMEYLQIQNVRNNKYLARAESGLQALRPEIQANPQLGKRMQDMTDYSLNATHDETRGFRKFVFNWMLAASMKYYWQSAFHLPLVGLPKFTEYSGSMLGAYKSFFDSGNLSRRYTSTGDTGNEQLNQLLKQAQTDGTTLPHNLENWLKPSDFDRSLASDGLFSQGSERFGAKLSEARVRASQKLQEFLSSTGVMAEVINRRISYIMAASHELKQLGRTATPEELSAIHKKTSSFVDDVNYVGDKANRPGIIQQIGQSGLHGPALAATTLQSFNINYLSQLASYWENGKIGSWDAGANARRSDGSNPFRGPLEAVSPTGNPSTKALYMAVGHMAMAAGIMGLPFFKDADDITQRLFRVNLTRGIREGMLKGLSLAGVDEDTGGHLTDAAVEGLPYAAGVDASQSLGLGSVLDIGMEGGKGFGVGGELVEKLSNSMQSLRNGGYADGNGWANFVRQSAPNFLSQWLKMADSQYRGVYSGYDGLPSSYQALSNPSVTSLALGFRPTQVSKDQELKAWNDRDADIKIANQDNTSNRAALALNQYKQTGDPSQLAKAQQIVNQFQDQYPQEAHSSITRDVANEQLSLLAQSMNVNLGNSYFTGRNQAALGSSPVNVKSKMNLFMTQIQTAQQLGDMSTLMGAANAGSRVRNDMLIDSLVNQGANPAVAQSEVNHKRNSIMTLINALSTLGQPGGQFQHPQQ